MKVLIYGGGAVGLGISSCLLKGGACVDIVARESTVTALRNNGLVRTGIFGGYRAKAGDFDAYVSLDEITGQSYDYVLVCVKSFDSAEAAKDIQGHKVLLGNGGKIVLLQNGWGNAEKFVSYFSKGQIYSGRVITGFVRRAPNCVEITVHADAVRVGSLFGYDTSAVKKLCEFISKGDLPCEVTDEVGRYLWAKMLYNCALNPLGAVFDVAYGMLAEEESTRLIMDNIVREVFSVMRVAGFETQWETVEGFLEVFYREQVPATYEHKSSTLQDIVAKKPTEIDALNGAVIRLAEQYGVEVPYNRVVYNMVRFIEQRRARNKSILRP